MPVVYDWTLRMSSKTVCLTWVSRCSLQARQIPLGHFSIARPMLDKGFMGSRLPQGDARMRDTGAPGSRSGCRRSEFRMVFQTCEWYAAAQVSSLSSTVQLSITKEVIPPPSLSPGCLHLPGCTRQSNVMPMPAAPFQRAICLAVLPTHSFISGEAVVILCHSSARARRAGA